MKHFLNVKTLLQGSLALILVLASLSLIDNNVVLASNSYKGVALETSTNVYGAASESSKVLKAYKQGSILSYRDFNDKWYSATVILNGVRTNGYIAKSDVDNLVLTQKTISGIGLDKQTKIHSTPSSGSAVLKSYDAGSLLKYKTFSGQWYEATVYVKGKKRTGYIRSSSVENKFDNQESFRGVALQGSTAVYSKASADSAKHKTYNQGTILKYKTFSENWHEATVYVRGKATAGYIRKNDVENAINEQRNLKGIGLRNPTAVYSRASASSSTLKTYSEGTILSYKSFTSDWYEAVVYVKGKRTTGYIQLEHTENVNAESEAIDGIALKTPTRVYAQASRNAKVIKTYNKPHQLKLNTFSPNWFSAKVYSGGKPVTAYFHSDDVSTDRILTTVTSYSTDFKRVGDIQITRAPQVSPLSGGGWTNASRNQVDYYINSSNFDKNSSSYFQFLVLSQPAGLNAKEVNSKILFDHGILTGQAQAFIDAGKKYNVNEAYLISHALLETGNGKSDLAAGVPVDNEGKIVAKEAAVHTVYNMYGIGAIDRCPLECGAKTAFDKGWFTPADAIVGGAEFVNDYILVGQDTLYKMRWNPADPGVHQYATDIGWAAKQTGKFEQIYDMLDNYVLIFDVPKYVNQPAKSGDPNAYLKIEPTKYPAGIFGKTSANVNFRTNPTTSSESLGTIPLTSKIEVLETNGTWYKAKFNGKTGWVHGDYVTLLNLLEVTVNEGLKVRPAANTSNTPLGTVKVGTLLPAVLDSNDKMIRSGDWYQITYQNKPAWVSGGKNGTEYIRVK